MTEYKSHNGLDLKEISPHDWPVRVGELTILLSNKVGYCGIVLRVTGDKARVGLLDWTLEDRYLEIPLYDCVPTRKSPSDLVKQYHPSPLQFSQALNYERSFPDFDSPAIAKSLKTKSKKKPLLSGAALVAALALLTPEQKLAMGALIKKNKEKETK